MSVQQYDDDEDDELELSSDETQASPSEKQPMSKVDAFGWALARWWGALFRLFFISVVGVVGYSWLSTESIGDIPFAELTLRQVFGHLFAVLIALGCISWFFHFPETDNVKLPESNPYIDWAKFGGWAVALAVLAIYWTNK